MKLNINKPLVVFDLETTGLDLVNDRIIQISYIKVMPNGEEKRASIFVNPGKPIPPLVQELTGITNERVKDEKTFKEIAKDLEKEFTLTNAEKARRLMTHQLHQPVDGEYALIDKFEHGDQ